MLLKAISIAVHTRSGRLTIYASDFTSLARHVPTEIGSVAAMVVDNIQHHRLHYYATTQQERGSTRHICVERYMGVLDIVHPTSNTPLKITKG
eukprot:scaffold22700_cov157-Skeletonema_dohrnii-CCMP3373.AAC.2